MRFNLVATLRGIVLHADANKPRSLQAHLGASEAGHPCARFIAAKHVGLPQRADRGDPWCAIVGTATHAWLADALGASDSAADWLIEHKITIPGYIESSTVDLFHIPSGTVIDHKILGTDSHRELRLRGPKEQYVNQVMLYGHGLALQGHTVNDVAIAAYPRSGFITNPTTGLHVWSAAYDVDQVEALLARLDAVAVAVGVLDLLHNPTMLAHIPATPTDCQWCPFYTPGDETFQRGCPGNTANTQLSESVSHAIGA